MSSLEIGIASFPILLLLIFMRVPIGLAMLMCGIGGTWIIMGQPNAILARLKVETFSTFSSYTLSIIPLFLLMGQFATLGGMSQSLFRAANTWIGHRKGRCRHVGPWAPALVSAPSVAPRSPPRPP